MKESLKWDVGCVLLAILTISYCGLRAEAGTLRASSETFWPVAQFSVSGVQVPGTPSQILQPDGTVLISLDVPTLIPHAAISLRVWAGDGTAIDAVLEDGSPGPLYLYRSIECRADLNDDHGVGLDDVSIVFGQARQGAACP